MKDPKSPTLKQARFQDNLTTRSYSLEEDKFVEIGLAETRSRSPPGYEVRACLANGRGSARAEP
jgi:hypothetical protein